MANDTPSPQVLDAIEAATAARDGSRRGPETTFTCPAHPDKHPSADWNHDKHTWLCRSCGAGGGWIDLARRLGIDPFPKAPKSVAPKGVTRYPVYDADGFPLAEKVREDSGTGEKSMHWEHNGKRGLPEGISPTDLLYGGIPQDTILSDTKSLFLVEGERAAQALIDAGYPAFGTTSGAQGVPSDAALSALLAHPVAIWADADDPGRNAAEAIALRLHALGNPDIRMVDWPEAPEKGDAADYCTLYGGDLSHLTIKHWQPPEDSWAPVLYAGQRLRVLGLGRLPAPQKPPDLVEGLIARGEVAAFIADGGTGKSVMLQAIVTALATGSPFAGMATRQCRCLYLDWEDNAAVFTDRVRRLYAGLGVPEPYPEIPWASMNELLKNGAEEVVKAVNELDAELIGIDTMGPAQGSADGSAERATLELFQAIRPLRGRAVVLLDHLAKGGDGKARKAYGSVYKGNLARSVWSVRGSAEGDIKHLVLTHEKSNHGPVKEPFGLCFTWAERFIRVQQEQPILED